MWRLTTLLLLVLLLSVSAFGQSTVVSGSIVDVPDGQAWFGGTFSFVFRVSPSNPTSQYFWNGVPFSSAQTIAGGLDGSGHYSVSVPSNTAITPAGSTWDLTICPQASAPCLIVQSVTITGGTQTVAPTPPSPRINMSSPAPDIRAYRDGELVAGALGQTYFNLTDTLVHVCNILPCTVWNPIGGVINVLTAPSGACTPGSIPEQVISTGVIYTCQAGLWAPIASSASAAGVPGQIQINIGGVLGVGGLSEASGVLTNADDTITRGPNPAVDVRAFGVRAVNTSSIPSPTATIAATTTSAVVSSNTGLKVGDGFAITNAGATQSMTTPVAPTVTPSCAAGLTGLGYTVPAGAGSTAYAYSLAMRDQGQGYTAASSNGTTATGNASLGANNTAITSIASGASNIFTATVASTANLAAGCMVIVKDTTDDKEFGGWKIIASIVDGTHFTYTSGIDASRGISTTTATGGTVYYWLCNHIVMPTPGAGGTQYAVYGRTSGSMAFLGMSLLANLGYTDASYNTWDDYGSTMMASPVQPWFIPSTPPGSPVNDTLVTTITNISGTTLTLANAATNNATSALSRFDNAPNIAAALAASYCTTPGCGGTIRFPVITANAAGNNCYVTSSYLVVSAVAVIQDDAVCLGDTLQLAGNWYGTDLAAHAMSAVPPNIMRQHIGISVSGANPGIYIKGGGLNKVNVAVGGNGGVGVFNVAGGNGTQVFEDDSFDSSGSSDYMTILFYDYEANFTGGFGGKVRNTSWSTGPTQVYGSTATPAFVSKFSGEWDFDYFTGNRRGWAFIPEGAGLNVHLHMGEEIQGPIMPVFTVMQELAGNVGGSFILDGGYIDTGAVPMLANLGPYSTNADITISGGNLPSSGVSSIPLISGNPFNGSVLIYGLSAGTQAGQNINVTNLGKTGTFTSSVKAPGMTLITTAASGNHTLVANEGAFISTGTGTITIDTTLLGQEWDVYSATGAGTTTLTVSAGTLECLGAVGPAVINNNTGVHVNVDNSGNAHCGGGGGTGGSSSGLPNALQSAGTAGSFQGTNAPTVPGDYVVHYPTPTSSSVAPARDLVGIQINAQTGANYVEGSANYQCDRGFYISASNVGAQTYTMGNPSGFCFSRNYFNVLDNINTGVVTETASGFTVSGGASFVTPPAWMRWLFSDGVNYFAEAVPTSRAFPTTCSTAITIASGVFSCGGAGNVSSWAGDGGFYSSTPQTGTVAAALVNASANTVWGRCTNSTGVPSYCQITDLMLTAASHAALYNAGNTWTGLQNFSGATLQIPTSPGCTAGATAMICYDSTNKNAHQYANNADAISLNIPSAPTNGDLADYSVVSSVVLAHDSGILTANVVTAASAATAAKQLCTSSGASKACSYIDAPDVQVIPAANCNNTTPGAGWSIGSGGAVTCRAGTNNLGGFIAITDTSSTFATFQTVIPQDWDSGTNPYIRFQLASTDATNGHTVIPSIQVACYKGDGSTTDDVAANAAHSTSTVTLNGNANRFWSTANVQMNSTDVTGCVAGALMQVTVGRATDTATNARFYSATLTFPRLYVVQAN